MRHLNRRFPFTGGLRSYDWWLKEREAICGHVEIHMSRFLSKNQYESCAISLRAMPRIRALELWFSKSLARHSDLISVILSRDEKPHPPFRSVVRVRVLSMIALWESHAKRRRQAEELGGRFLFPSRPSHRDIRPG